MALLAVSYGRDVSLVADIDENDEGYDPFPSLRGFLIPTSCAGGTQGQQRWPTFHCVWWASYAHIAAHLAGRRPYLFQIYLKHTISLSLAVLMCCSFFLLQKKKTNKHTHTHTRMHAHTHTRTHAHTRTRTLSAKSVSGLIKLRPERGMGWLVYTRGIIRYHIWCWHAKYPDYQVVPEDSWISQLT